jgi:hypothetical protein
MRRALLVAALIPFAWTASFIASPRRECTGPTAPEAAVPVVRLDSRRVDYLEDEGTGRRLAELRLELAREAGAVSLRIVATAVGPRVDPIPGWQGVAGANRITAEEFASILRRGRLSVEVDGVAPDEPRFGTVRGGRQGHIPERRRRPDGAIDFDALTGDEYPLELVAITPPLGTGARRTRLLLDGKPRLEVTTFTSLDHGRIREVRMLSEHDEAKVGP